MRNYYNLVRGKNIYNRILQSIETADGIHYATMNLCKENKSLNPTKPIKPIKEKLILISHTPMPALYGWTLITNWKDIPDFGMIARFDNTTGIEKWSVSNVPGWKPEHYDQCIPNYSTDIFAEMLKNKRVYARYHVAVTSDVYVDSYLQIAIWEEILNDNLIDKLTK